MNAPMDTSATLDFIWLELTNKCNLECVHCYALSGPDAGHTDAIDHNNYMQIIRDAYQQGCRRIQFIGGEVTLYRQLVELLGYTQDLGYDEIEVFTNLVSLPGSLLEEMRRRGISVAMSFYSDDPATHDAITTRPGSWKKTVANLKRVLAAGISCRASVILMEQNHDHFEATRGFLHGLGVTRISSDRARAFGRAAGEAGCGGMDELCGNCANGVLCVSANGKVHPCIMSRQWEMGDVHTSGIGDILRSGELHDFREQLTGLVAASLVPVPNDNWCGPDSPCSPCGPADCSPNRYCEPHKFPRPTAIPD